ncbi:WD repeat-containing protein WRAP73-like isoform X2 [Tachypleus tridentatus]|uniref:WD repeat-containing protein WRAP73-like isoform X2 n=1 Tax=Tachypleus tridentatus TaxID=6853 RepID=UPI003FD50095
MNFSQLFKQTNGQCEFSPDGRLLAYTNSQRLFIRDVQSLQVVCQFTCIDAIEKIEWASDSTYILCGLFKRRVVQVWSVEETTWTCKIDEGSLGLIDVSWSPDGRHILTTAKFHLRITIWSLVNKSVSYIKYPKAIKTGLAFRNDGKYLALAERRDCKDYISIFVCSTWQHIKHYETDTRDLAGLAWSPDDRVLCVWESLTEDYKVVFYSVDGRCLGSYLGYQMALGIKSVTWSPTSQFLAVGSYDQKVRLLNSITWKTIIAYDHSSSVTGLELVVYREVEKKKAKLKTNDVLAGSTSPHFLQTKYEVLEDRPVAIASNPLDPNKPNPRHGIGTLSFSSDSCFLASISDNMPTTIWIWDVKNLVMSDILIQAHPVKSWDPIQARLAICCSNNYVYFWSSSGCLCVEIPCEGPFHASSVKWHSSGEILMLMSKDSMCVCYLSS